MRIFQVDAFTTVPFSGNPATIVLDADGRGDEFLAAVAREFAHAETAFVMAASAADHDVRVRFFNARGESPFVGHATIAVHAVLHALGRRNAGAWRQHSGTGIVPVSLRTGSLDSPPLIEFRQTAPQLGAPLPLKTTLRVAEALRLPATLLHESMPARIAIKGSSRLLLPVAEARHLRELEPNFDTLLLLGQELAASGFFAFAVDTQGAALTTESRMFCPALGIPEDPVSGNAHSMLAAYLWNMGIFDGHSPAFLGRQGSYVQRAGEVHVRLEVEHGEFLAAHIGGNACIISEGSLAV